MRIDSDIPESPVSTLGSAPDLNPAAWYVVHTKPKQESRAFENLHNQGFVCFMPTLQVQRRRGSKVVWVQEPMFSRYLFIQLSAQTQSWTPIRSTLGVSKLVSFGQQPARVPQSLIDFLQHAPLQQQLRLFTPGADVRVADGPLKGLEGRYAEHDGLERAFVLIELLGQPQRLSIALSSLQPA